VEIPQFKVVEGGGILC